MLVVIIKVLSVIVDVTGSNGGVRRETVRVVVEVSLSVSVIVSVFVKYMVEYMVEVCGESVFV